MRTHLFPFATMALALLALLATACGSESEPRESGSELPVEEVSVRWASAVAADLPTLLQNTDVAFVGTVSRKTGQRDEPLAVGTVRETNFPISLYEVVVEESITGEVTLSNVVTLEQAGGEIESSDGQLVQVKLEHDPTLRVGQRYLFFATVKDNGALTAAPYARMPIEDGRVREPEGWRGLGAGEHLAGLRISDAIDEVRNAR